MARANQLKALLQSHIEGNEQMTVRDLAALSPLMTQHINPYGRFELDMETRLPIEA